MKAIADILREAADKIAALDPPATLTASEPSLPDPPKPSPLAGLISPIGFHPAMMGPIPVPAENFNLDIVKLIQGKWASGWLGNDPDGGTYALRIGSEIARLNGLELRLELGRTYATNSGQIVSGLSKSGLTGMPERDVFHSERILHPEHKGWNSIGQALIDGVAHPLWHPDSIKEEIPAELLPLPNLPDGFKELRWRGFEWTTNHEVQFYFFGPANCWHGGPSMPQKAKGKKGYYIEAIPADKQPEPVKRREWDVHLDKLGDIWDCVEVNEEMDDGMICVRVREVLPGDPTPEQVEELVRALDSISRRSVIMGSTGDYRDGQLDALAEVRTIAKTALQPFTGKEPS